jgi:hypothetical protein
MTPIVSKSFFAEHGRSTKRMIHVGNLDPAADNYEYEPSFDIKVHL